jgi:gentisate 1,2-dioxygenase
MTKAAAVSDIRSTWQTAHLVPLWESPNAHKPPSAPEAPYVWAWRDVRPHLDEALKVTSPAAVERRVLQLVNPKARLPDEEWTVKNISAALQILLPGEVARPHRHSMNALRFVIEGTGAITVVNGKPCPMEVGDLILTPGGCWHHHHHDGNAPTVWLDALDVPLHLYLGTASFEPGPIKQLPPTVPDAAFAIPNIVPQMAEMPTRSHSPVFRFPYQDAVAALTATPAGPGGFRHVRYVNPLTGGVSMALMDSSMIQVDAHTQTRPYRTNSNAICVVIEGSGTAKIGNYEFVWDPKDTFTVPQNNWVTYKCDEQASRIFIISDRDILSRLGLFEEEYASAPGQPHHNLESLSLAVRRIEP